MCYTPKPIDTSGVLLPSGLVSLLEALAVNSHEQWAAQRIRDGWVYGENRDDRLKTHPCLVPFGMLPESEKEYDRLIAREILKAIHALGYRIIPPEHVIPDKNQK